jgi:hypothetical protein
VGVLPIEPVRKRFEIQLCGFAQIREGFLFSMTLARSAKVRTFGDEPVGVGIGVDNRRQFHALHHVRACGFRKCQQLANPADSGNLRAMSQLTISLPETLDAALAHRMAAAGFDDKQAYLVELVRADCAVDEIEGVLEARDAGPFAPLEPDWKEKVRAAAKRHG